MALCGSQVHHGGDQRKRDGAACLPAEVRKKLISMAADAQFQTTSHRISNLDRCGQCGAARSAHGIDWTCSPGTPPRNGRLMAGVIVAGLLALAGVALLTATSSTSQSLGTLGAAACLAGLTVLVCYAALISRRRQLGRSDAPVEPAVDHGLSERSREFR
jgi:hypothetical protein